MSVEKIDERLYRASVTTENKANASLEEIDLGCWTSEQRAALAVDMLLLKLFGAHNEARPARFIHAVSSMLKLPTHHYLQNDLFLRTVRGYLPGNDVPSFCRALKKDLVDRVHGAFLKTDDSSPGPEDPPLPLQHQPEPQQQQQQPPAAAPASEPQRKKRKKNERTTPVPEPSSTPAASGGAAASANPSNQPSPSPSVPQDGRNVPNKWSQEEIAVLVKGVEEFGAGKWREILAKYRNNGLDSNRVSDNVRSKWKGLVAAAHTDPGRANQKTKLSSDTRAAILRIVAQQQGTGGTGNRDACPPPPPPSLPQQGGTNTPQEVPPPPPPLPPAAPVPMRKAAALMGINQGGGAPAGMGRGHYPLQSGTAGGMVPPPPPPLGAGMHQQVPPPPPPLPMTSATQRQQTRSQTWLSSNNGAMPDNKGAMQFPMLVEGSALARMCFVMPNGPASVLLKEAVIGPFTIQHGTNPNTNWKCQLNVRQTDQGPVYYLENVLELIKGFQLKEGDVVVFLGGDGKTFVKALVWRKGMPQVSRFMKALEAQP